MKKINEQDQYPARLMKVLRRVFDLEYQTEIISGDVFSITRFTWRLNDSQKTWLLGYGWNTVSQEYLESLETHFEL